MSTDTSSLFQMVHERGELARELARWLKSAKVWLQPLIWLLIIVLILIYTITGLRQATQAAAAAGESPPQVETVLLYGVFVGMLAAFGTMNIAMFIARGAIVARRSGMAAWRSTPWRMQGKPEAVSPRALERGRDADREPMDPNTASALRARMLLAQASLERATRLLQRPLEAVETGERFESAIEILNFQAWALEAPGKPIPAMAALERALALAESEQTAPSQTQPPKQVLAEPLSEREQEVLQLIAEGLTNPEIATRLYLSLNTIKAHTRNIYGKLDVHSRTQAVARARDGGAWPLSDRQDCSTPQPMVEWDRTAARSLSPS